MRMKIREGMMQLDLLCEEASGIEYMIIKTCSKKGGVTYSARMDMGTSDIIVNGRSVRDVVVGMSNKVTEYMSKLQPVKEV